MPVNPDAIKDPKALAKELQSLGLSSEDAMNFIKEPVTKMVKDGVVVYAPNINQRFADNVFPIRVNGQDRFIFFNTKNPAAVRLVSSLKNIDAQQLAGIVGMTAKITRFVAAMNTQYNPVFGAWNFVRDVFGGTINLASTELADQKAKVLFGATPAMLALADTTDTATGTLATDATNARANGIATLERAFADELATGVIHLHRGADSLVVRVGEGGEIGRAHV